MAALRVVIYEGPGSRPWADEMRFELMKGLLERGYSVTSARADGQVSSIDSGSLVVLGRFEEQKPRQAENDRGKVKLYFRDIAGLDCGGVLDVVEAVRGEAAAPKPGGWKPWFPVIDFGRCTNCMQCLSFCLFDVYGVTAGGKITVQNQSNCKTDCPACSRVCPEVAILFPKYRTGPINGDEINSEDVRREAMKVDISALLGGDIYSMLRDRSAKAKSRFSKERDEGKALNERQVCLARLQEQLDIPAELLASLPSIEQIQAKAEQAKARAAEALRKSIATEDTENTESTEEEDKRISHRLTQIHTDNSELSS
jgi:Pyruvate/2-oxoacid:ferredoxin oxidoreductase delta subunit